MIEHLHRPPEAWLARVLGNAGLLVLAILLMTSLGLGRFALALVWLGALLVLFVQTFEAGWLAAQRDTPEERAGSARAAYARRIGAVRLLGAACALLGVIVGFS